MRGVINNLISHLSDGDMLWESSRNLSLTFAIYSMPCDEFTRINILVVCCGDLQKTVDKLIILSGDCMDLICRGKLQRCEE